MQRVAAVDLGAGSGRVCVIDLDAVSPRIDVVERFTHEPVLGADGLLRWNWAAIMDGVRRGLATARTSGELVSIGVDTWGVDYGLLDAGGQLVADPLCYRGGHTSRWAETADDLGRDRLYATAGIQLMPINTVFQLAGHPAEELARAERLLMLPELVVHQLCGVERAELTSAATTGLLDARTGEWAADVLTEIGISSDLFLRPVSAGVTVGEWEGIPVQLVGGHDTASAVAGLGYVERGSLAHVSMGTWILAGIETDRAHTDDSARRANLSNERGVFGGFRLLRNIAGMWLIERCRQHWGVALERVMHEAANTPPGPLFDARSDRFLAPLDMPAEIVDAAGLPATATRGAIVRCAIDSVAATTCHVLDEIATIAGVRLEAIRVVGGGTRAAVLVEAIRTYSGLPVSVGPVEATSLGNALAQGVAIGRFEGPADARAWSATA